LSYNELKERKKVSKFRVMFIYIFLFSFLMLIFRVVGTTNSL